MKHFQGVTWVPDSGAYSQRPGKVRGEDLGAQGRPDCGGRCWPFLPFLLSCGLVERKGKVVEGSPGALLQTCFRGMGR